MHMMCAFVSTVAETVDDEERKFARLRDMLGEDWTVVRVEEVPDAA